MSRKYNAVADEIDPRHRSSKDTRRWCRGVVGREHDKQWTPDTERHVYSRLGLPYYEVLRCVNCRKEFERRKKQWQFGELVAAIRKAKGIRQEDMGMAQPQLSHIENGHCSPTLETVQRIMELLGVQCVLDVWECGEVVLNKPERR